MATKTYKQLDAEAGRKYKRLESKAGKEAKKRVKQFTTITPVGKKTQWYY